MDWQEFWLPIEGWPRYEVSNYGDVRNKETGAIMQGSITWRGYSRVELKNKGKGKKFVRHRLVMKAFSANPNNYPEVNHINGVKGINIATNLEWCSNKQNKEHAIKTGLITPEMMGRARVSVDKLDLNYGFIKNYPTLKEAAADTGGMAANIRRCVNGKGNTCAGFRWRLAE